MSALLSDALDRAADLIRSADALLIGAGAGMGVDSGLPDFRGNQGFWRAYPPLQDLGIGFMQMANPRWFVRDPTLAWGFYGHRLHLYRDTAPHAGFAILAGMRPALPRFVFTSNVDGQFQKAGFGEGSIYEIHGSIHWLQCVKPCSSSVWSAVNTQVDVEPETFRARGKLPKCPLCGALARPNIVMFGDGTFTDGRVASQQRRYNGWERQRGRGRVAVIEIGAGVAIPSVRYACEDAARPAGCGLIRINPREPQGPAGTIELPVGGLAALEAIAARL